MMIVGMVTVVAGAVSGIAQAVKSVLPSHSPPQIIINNYNTIINPPAPTDGGIADSPKEGSVGRRKQMEKKKKKAPRKRDSGTTYEI
jgi:hypothetical protein